MKQTIINKIFVSLMLQSIGKNGTEFLSEETEPEEED